MRKLLVCLVVLAALALALLFFLRQPRRISALPNPNGYDDFLNAIRLINGDAYGASTNTHAVFGKFISANAEPLRLARVGLSRDCQIPIDDNSTNTQAMMNNLAGLKRLGLLLKAEGQFAEQENRTNDAVQSYLACIAYGEKISRGGFIIHRLVGIACESLGYDPLSKMVPSLSCEQSRPIIAELEKIQYSGITWQEVSQGERRYFESEVRQTINPIRWGMAWYTARAGRQKSEEKHNRTNARLRLLTVELALRCYQADHGRAADNLEQLVSKYIQRVPPDPFSQQPLRYRALDGTNWVLYSVGIDRVDNGGQPVTRTLSGKIQTGDLFYDSPY